MPSPGLLGSRLVAYELFEVSCCLGCAPLQLIAVVLLQRSVRVRGFL
ncbi:MAG: hypothetical protein IH786_12470 [Proteobacteria bacterium]|nr:hypothetical protein [Pseudomonadota bacterium]